MSLGRWARDARFSLALLGPLGGTGRIPSAPAHAIRDPWPGNPATGERIARGVLSHAGFTRPQSHGRWQEADWPEAFRDWLQGFTWLRDLRELGSESARMKARTLVATWIGQSMSDTPLRDPGVTGARITAWLGHYDFFAASADDGFRHALMTRLVLEARTISALMPVDHHGWQALSALKGLLAAAVALPQEQGGFLPRFMKLIDAELERQMLPDGCHVSRSPEAQFQTLRELAEMRLMLQGAKIPIPTTLAAALDRMSPALRAMRHGDGRLILFNGALPHEAAQIDMVIARATPRGQVVARALPDGKLMRLPLGRALLFVDCGEAPSVGQDGLAHAGALSFELSSGRHGLVVNCGSSPLPEWRRALRDSAAHSVLTVDGHSAMERDSRDMLARRPKVTCTHRVQNDAHLLEMTHDGYRPLGCGVYHRTLYCSGDGTDFRGEDRLENSSNTPFTVRFHLHPDVRIEADEEDILLHTRDETWRFNTDGAVAVEESVYFGGKKPVACQQLAIRPMPVKPLPEARAEIEPAPETVDEEAAPLPHDIESDAAPDVTALAEEEEAAEEAVTVTDEVAAPTAATQEAVSAEPEEEQPEPAVIYSDTIRWAFTRLDG